MTTNIQPNHHESVHRQVVRSYFHKVLDQGNVELIEDLFHPQCVMHRPGGTVVGLDAVRNVVAHRKETFSQFGTEIHDMFGSGGRVVARLTHRGVGGGIWRLRPGSFDISGKTVTWNAIAIFRFEADRIIEEWVTRDELGIILQLGLFPTV
ncbi:MAG: ester cyclase [Deltaproteobacteria bacterium]|nr:ester cyclase [Deltaproteobacteria bacterium]